MTEPTSLELSVALVTGSVATVVVLAAVAGAVAAVVAFLVRLYSREPSPPTLNVLAGLGAIGLWLNLSGSLGHFVEGEAALTEPEVAAVNVAALAAGAVAASYGGRIGDHAGVELSTLSSVKYQGDVAALVRSAGRNVRVKLPDDVEDIDGYDPVDPEVKREVAGSEYVFPRGLTVDEVRGRLVDRLKEEFDVGYVDVDVDEKGEVGFLGLGSRLSGLGPTLGPGTQAVALRADPAFAASPGDQVQIWRTGESGSERVASGELRGAAGDVVTVALDESDARKVVQTESYRLVTLPSEKGPDKELAAMLRSADETMAAVEVVDDGVLEGLVVDALDVPVVAVRTTAGDVEAVPDGERGFSVGETVYVVGRPDQLRRLTG